MDLLEIQTRLNEIKLFPSKPDGIWDLETGLAVNAYLNFSKAIGYQDWGKDRKIIACQQCICRADGIDPGQIDGIMGAQTRYALSIYESRKAHGGLVTTDETWRNNADMNTPAKQASSKWPTRAQLNSFYGPPGSNCSKIKVPYPLQIAWIPGKYVDGIVCNRKVHEPTLAALEMALNHYGLAEIKRLRLDYWGGSLNVRKVRGGSLWSIHAWGAAHDFDPINNQLKTRAPKATFSHDIYDYWWECWEAQGAVSQGRALGYDWMHVQFAKY